MASPKRNVAYEFDIGLIDTADTGAFKASPTIAAGDFKVSTDNGALANLATLPVVSPAGSIIVKINLSAAEMNGDKIMIQAIDAAGNEWDDVLIFVDATVVNVDDIVRSTTPANPLDVNATGEAGIDLDNTSGTLSAAQIAANAIGASELAADAIDKIRDGILSDSTPFAGADIAETLTDTADMQPKLGTPAGASMSVDIADVPTVAEFNARTIAAANYALEASVQAIQNNTRTHVSLSGVMERPDSGNTQFKIYLNNYDTVGNMEAPDSAPTVAVANESGTDRSGNLQHPTTHVPQTTMVLVSTGRYQIEYELDSADTSPEQLLFTFTIIEGGVTRQIDRAVQVVDTTAVDFTAADRSKLDTLHDTRLTAARAANLDELGAANIPSDVDAVKTKTDSLTFSGTDLHADVKQWKAAAPNDLNAGRVSAREQPTEEGTAQAGASLSITLRAGASSTTDDPSLILHMVRIVAGTGAGQRRLAVTYNGTTKVLDVGSAWATTPDATSVYEILEANFVDANLEAWRQVDVPLQQQSSGHVGVSPPVIVVDIDDGGIDPVSGLYDIGDNALAGRILGIIGAKKNFDDLNDPTTAAIATAVLTTVMTESYAAKGDAMTLAQALHLLSAGVGRISISGTTLTVYKLDGVTVAATYTLDDPDDPTSRTRAT